MSACQINCSTSIDSEQKVQLLRISRHYKEQNWFAVSLELFIVFLAVFIGLQADNWNQERIAKETATTYYSRLIEDMRAAHLPLN
jgi:hypothetical protein